MKNRFSKGSSTTEAVIVLLVLFLILLLFILPARKVGPGKGLFSGSGGSLFSDSIQSSDTGNETSSSVYTNSGSNSSYSESISLGTGNASYAYQPNEEYITIDNYGSTPINITGWKLKNGKDKRPFELSGTIRTLASDIVTIPRAAKFVSPNGSSIPIDVILMPGESAVVTTGSISNKYPYTITSFKENKCSGYLEALGEYTFEPSLDQSCVDPSQEIGISNLDIKCQDYIDGISSCHTPEYGTKDAEGQSCSNCVDGTRLSQTCTAYIKNHYNYSSCISNHQNDPDFSGRTWRIFLGQRWELWAEKRENITLIDKYGKIVSTITY